MSIIFNKAGNKYWEKIFKQTEKMCLSFFSRSLTWVELFLNLSRMRQKSYRLIFKLKQKCPFIPKQVFVCRLTLK